MTMIYDPAAPAAPTVEQVDQQLADLAKEQAATVTRMHTIEQDPNASAKTAAEYGQLSLKLKSLARQVATLEDERREAVKREIIQAARERANKQRDIREQRTDKLKRADEHAGQARELYQQVNRHDADFMTLAVGWTDNAARAKAHGYEVAEILTADINDQLAAIKREYGVE